MKASSAERKIGYVFADKSLLAEALTHGAYAHLHGCRSYDRMEYLGDALLDFIVAEELYRRFPDANEGEMTASRIDAVSEKPLAKAARAMGLGSEIKAAAHLSDKDSVLSDVFEAVLAAIYLDGGAEPAREYVIRNLSEHLRVIGADGPNEKTLLYERLGQDAVRFVEEARSGPAHAPQFTIALYVDGKFAARAQGGSKKQAERECARIYFQSQQTDGGPQGEI